MAQAIPVQVETSLSAEWQLLFGRKPWLELLKVGSKTVSRTSLIASCTILSLGEAMAKGLVFPLALGIWTRLAGLNWKSPFFRDPTRDSMTSLDIPSRVKLSEPGVMLPGLDFMLW